MKFSTIRKASLATALLIVATNVDSAWSGNCYDALVNEKYRCKYKYESGLEYVNTCARFLRFPPPSQKMFLHWTNIVYECACTAKGSYARPQYEQGKDFLCSSTSPGYDDAFSGKVLGNGDKIKGLYYI